MNKKLILSILTILTCLALVGCGSQSGPGQDQVGGQKHKEVIKVGTWKTAQTIQPFLYNQFLEENDKVEVLPFTNPGDQKTALLAGDLSMCGTTLVTAITAASKDEPVVMVANLCNKCSALVVKKDGGIDSVSDLEGKTIAYVPGTMHHLLLLEALQKADLDPNKDVQLRRIDFFDMGQALAQGQIDAFLSGEPYPSIALTEGYGHILSYPYFDDSVGTINAAMLTTKDQIEKNREVIQKLVTAHVEATRHFQDNPQEWLELAHNFGTDLKVLEIAADNMELAWDMSDEFIEQAKKLAEKMLELGMINKLPDVEDLFDTSFIEQAKKDLTE